MDHRRRDTAGQSASGKGTCRHLPYWRTKRRRKPSLQLHACVCLVRFRHFLLGLFTAHFSHPFFYYYFFFGREMRSTCNVTSQNRHLHVRNPALLQPDATVSYKPVPLICAYMQFDSGQCRTNSNISLSIAPTSGLNHRMDL